MADYSIAEAKNKLPSLVAKAEAGEVVTITKRGRPVAELRGKFAKPSLSPEERAALYERIGKMRESFPESGITSVELLREVYEGDPD